MTLDEVRPWAKLLRDVNGHVLAALPLIDHSLDVAAVFEVLVAGGAWRTPLEEAAGRPLTDLDFARLTVLVALHDIGKANVDFQARFNPKAQRVGHEREVAALAYADRWKSTEAAKALVGMRRQWGAGPYLPALMAHHGRPRPEFDLNAKPPLWPDHAHRWRREKGYDPTAEAMRLIEQVRARWPSAWDEGEKLPDNPRFVSLFAGLVTLADWLGSDATRFPVQGPYGEAREPLRRPAAYEAVHGRGLAAMPTPDGDFEAAFGFPPKGVQEAAGTDDFGPVALFEAETGSGKTEAALWRWLALRRRRLVDGLFFALPTRSAAVQLHGRVQKMLDTVWGKNVIRAVLAVPGYLRAGDATGQALPDHDVLWEDDGGDDRWAAESSRRYLAARVAVGTIDQALLGGIQVPHAHFRAAALSRSLLVVDEVHASDAYMGALLEQLIANHRAVGGHALLLSATLGSAARARLLKQEVPSVEAAAALPYPAAWGSDPLPRAVPGTGKPPKRVTVEVAGLIDDPDAIAERAIAAARQGASVLVVRNSVNGAIAVAQKVEEKASEFAFEVEGVSTLHHGRFAPSDRKLLDTAVEDVFGKKRTAAGRILVGTQTLEQSLDLDADLLITDLAPMDVLLQRIGRLHRHERHDRGAFAEARVIVLRREERDLSPLLGIVRDRHGMGTTDKYRGAYPNLLQLEATLRLLDDNPAITIPADNRRLVECALHPEVLEALASALGWQNHQASNNASDHADGDTAKHRSLDMATPFASLSYHRDGEAITTRLGEQALLVDFAEPMAGPFGEPVDRIAIPHWMAGGIGRDDKPEPLDEAWHFRLGKRTYVYDRWGLRERR